MNGFFNLPKGSFIQLEKQAKEYILKNIKSSCNTRANLVSKIKYFEQDTGLELTIENFLNYHHISLYDLYGKNKNRSFTRMKVEATIIEDFDWEQEDFVTGRLQNLFFLNSSSQLKFLLSYIADGKVSNVKEKMLLNMFYYSFYKAYPAKEGLSSIEEGVQKILANQYFKREIQEILSYQYYSLKTMEIENDFAFKSPLKVHCNYSTTQVLAALDYYNDEKTPAFREGVKYFEDKKLDIFFITLNKSEKDFSPSTLYEDYAINERLFHWQTQSKVSENSPTGQRYIHHKKRKNQIALFVREYKQENGHTSPFVFLGTADYISHTGNKPMSFIWKLREEMPSGLVPKANKNIL